MSATLEDRLNGGETFPGSGKLRPIRSEQAAEQEHAARDRSSINSPDQSKSASTESSTEVYGRRSQEREDDRDHDDEYESPDWAWVE